MILDQIPFFPETILLLCQLSMPQQFYLSFHLLKNTIFAWTIITVFIFRLLDNNKKVNEILDELKKPDKELANKVLNGVVDKEIKDIMNEMLHMNKDLLEYLSPNKWAENINNKVFVIHGANDSMVPFTESVYLADLIPNSELLISFLYEHREISTDRGILFKVKELIKMINFFANYFRYNK